MSGKTVYLFLLVGIASVLIYVVSSYLVSQLIAQRNRKVTLVVAKHDYPKGTTISDPEQMFELREMFDRDAPGDRVFDLEKLRNQTLTSDIGEGQPVQSSFLQKPKDATNRVKLDPPGPGRKYIGLLPVKAREESIRVGTRVDVIQRRSKGDAILLHDVVVRNVRQLPQETLGTEGEPGFVALSVTLDGSVEEVEAIDALIDHSESTVFELRPSGDNKKVGEKNSAKVP